MKDRLKLIQETAFNFFNDYTNLDENSEGYGLTVDHSKNKDLASIASTGFTLSSYIIADKYGYLEREEILKRIIGTLKTLYYNVSHYEGFFAHFVNIHTGKRHNKVEYSTIDTALALNGIIAVNSYFDNEEIKKYSDLIIKRVNWKKFFHIREDELVLYMAYNDDPKGEYAEGKAGFIHHWKMFAEQLMMYLIIAGDNRYTEKESMDLYNGFDRIKGSYNDISYYYSPGNTLFIYQFPLAWLNMKSIVDNDNISWYDNAKKAILSQYEWCTKGDHNFKTYGKHLFGLTACDTKTGYSVHQALPNVNDKPLTDGTVAAHAVIGSLPFLEKESLEAINEMFKIPNFWNEKYGFYDSFSNEEELWVSDRFFGIDKGLELLMVNAYLDQTVQDAYMNSDIIKKGMEKLKWKKI